MIERPAIQTPTLGIQGTAALSESTASGSRLYIPYFVLSSPGGDGVAVLDIGVNGLTPIGTVSGLSEPLVATGTEAAMGDFYVGASPSGPDAGDLVVWDFSSPATPVKIGAASMPEPHIAVGGVKSSFWGSVETVSVLKYGS
ncbi:MAG: hypothetical protein AAGB51_00995 [Planctomycetota bacterium]